MEIKHYLLLVRQWLWLIILSALVAGGVTYAVSSNSPKVYSANARLIVDAAPGATASQIDLEQRLIATYLQVIRSREVFNEVAQRLGTSSVQGSVSVSSPEGTQIIDINVEANDADMAAAIANTVGEVFIEQNLERETDRYADNIARYEESLEQLRDDRENVMVQINELGEPNTAEGEAALARLQTELREIEVQHNQNFNDLEGLRISQARESNKIQIFQRALANDNEIRPQPRTNAILAATVGALLALGVIFLIEYLDDTVKNPEQVAEVSGLSTLGAIAFIKGNNPNDRLITVHTPRAPVSEAYRVFRTNLNFAAVDGDLKAILVTSSSPSEGKSTTTANLAVVLAQTGQRVCIVDADLRRPMQHKIFGTPNNHGLTTALLDAATPVLNHVQMSKISGLSIMSSGPIPPNPAELLNSQRMSKVLEELKEQFDVLIFDSPPALTVADASILAPQVDGCVLVVEGGKTRVDALIDATERLAKSGAHLLGVVMNQLRSGRSGYYDYYYYRYYSYDYSSRRNNRRGWRLAGWFSSLGRR